MKNFFEFTRLIHPEYLYRVLITEYERGYGQREDDRLYFRTKQDAIDFCKMFNSQNLGRDELHDVYLRADYIGILK